MKSRIIFLALMISLFLGLPAMAGTVETATAHVIERVFSEAEHAIIEEYFGISTAEHGKGKKAGLPPGLAKKKELPPGLQKQLEKNGRLPPGLAKRDLPSDLLKKLPPPAKGTKRQIVGADVVLIDAATEVILDVIHNAAK